MVWYDAATDGNVVANPTQVGVGSVTYYAASKDDNTGCESLTRTAVTLTINAAPDAPTATALQVACDDGSGTQSITAAATAPTGSSVVWYDAETSGNIVADPIQTGVGSVTYYAASKDDLTGCESLTRTAVTLTIDATPAVTTLNACEGGGTVNFTQTGGTINGTWSVSGGGTIDPQSGEFTPATPGYFTATYTTPNGACSDTKSFVVFPAAPPAPTVNPDCNTDIVVTPPASVPGFTVQYNFDDGRGWIDNNDPPTLDYCPGYQIKTRYVTAGFDDIAAGIASLNSACAESPATLRKLDKTPPIASNPAPINVQCINDIPAPDPLIVTDAHDNCTAIPIVSFMGDANNGGSGTTTSPYIVTRTYSVSDECGNTTNVTQTITVVDNMFPTIQNGPNSIVAYSNDLDPSSCSQVVIWTPPTAIDNCGGVTVSSNHNPGESFPVGNTTVTYTFTDSHANSVSYSFNVTVIDNTPPVINNCPGNIISCSPIVGWTAPMVTDNCPGASIVQTSGPLSGSTFPLGTTTILYTATDAHNNHSTCSFTVTVLPPANAGTISGPATVCQGSTINLSTSGSSGGMWTSGNTLLALVDPTTGVVTGVAPGSPTIFYTVTNSCGTSIAQYTITVNGQPNAGTITGPSNVCAGSSVFLTSTGDPGGIWISGSPSIATVVNPAFGLVSGVSAGPALIFYIIQGGCTPAAASFLLTVDPAPNPGVISGPSSVCVGSQITLSSNGTTGGVWSSSNESIAIVDPATGVVTGIMGGSPTIFYTVTNSCGTFKSQKTITINATPNAGNINGVAHICANSSVFFSIVNGDPGGTWSSNNTNIATVNPSTGQVTGVATGNTTIVYSVSNGCGISSTTPFAVTIDPAANAGTISGPTTLCVGGSPINLSTNGDPNGTWSSSNEAVAIVNSSGVVTGIAPGSPTIFYKVTNSCGTVTASYPITVSASPAATITPNGPTTFCTGGSVVLTASAGSSWFWSTGAMTQSITVSTDGSYTVTVTNASGCSATSAATVVTVNPAPTATITAGGPTTFCTGGSVVLTASAGSSWLWSTGETTQSITVSTSGSYTVTVTNASGCSASSAATVVTVNPAPTATITAGGPTTFCTGGSVVLTASAGSSWLWSTGETTQSITVSTSGSYSVTVTNASGCSATSAATVVTVNPAPTATITAGGPTTFCTGGSVVLTASAGNSWLWSTGETTQSITVSTSGSYTVTVTNASGCSATSAATIVTVNPAPTATITAGGPTTFCTGGSVVLTASAGDSWLWSTGETTQSITVSTSGSYTVTVTNAGGCSATSAATVVTVNPAPTAIITAGGPTTFCTGGSVVLTASAGSSWLWSTGATTQSITVSTSGSYTVTVTNASGCSATSTATVVTVNPAPTAIVTAGGPTTFCTGGSVVLIASAGSSWLWSTGETTQSITVSTSGSYTVTVTNAGGCSATSAATVVTVNPVPPATITPSGPTTFCTGGSVVLIASAGSSWLWSTGQTTQFITVSTSGSYTVTVTNAGGCSATSAATVVTVNPPPTATITAGGPTTFCTGGSVVLTASAGSAWLWSTGATTQSITVSTSGSYTVTVTNASGCSAISAPTVVTVVPPATATITPGGVTTFCSGGFVTLTASAGSSWLWSTGETTQSIVVTSSGTYTVTVTNAGGCSATSAPTVVTVNPAPIATITPGGPTTFCTGGSVVLTASAGTSWLWSDGETTQSITANTSGSYTVTVRNISGCSAMSAPTIVTVNPSPVAPIVGTVTQPTCDVATGSVVLSGLPSGNWTINPGNTPGSGSSTTIMNLSANTYHFTVTNEAGCISSATGDVVINAQPAPPAAPTGNSIQTFCTSATINDLVASGSNIKWYDAATGGSPLAGNTVLVNGNHYYASQTVGSCESVTRLNVTAVINTFTINCPQDITVNTVNGVCNASVTIPTPTVTGNCGVVVTGSELVTNGNFNAGSANWNDCGNIVEVNPETGYGGTTIGNIIAEVDPDATTSTTDDRTLCQTITGFIPGKTYILTLKASRRTNPSGAPTTVGANIVIDGSALTTSVTRTNTVFSLTTSTFTFTATQTTHQLRLTPTSQWGTGLGLIVDDISIKAQSNGTITNSFNNTSDASGSYPVGTTPVVWTANDGNGHISTCTQIVTVNASPLVINTQPVSLTRCEGESATFSVASASATGYQWQLNTGNGWNNIGGQISSSLNIASVTTAMNGNQYRVLLTGLCSSATSNAVTLTVNPLPIVYTLTGSEICPNAPNTGTIVLSNSQTGVSYQLKNSGNNNVQAAKTGAGSLLTWTGLAAGNGYYVVATGSGCSSQTNMANVSIIAVTTATISYDGSPYCNSDVWGYVTMSGQSGGTYSSTPGLSINAVTGTINLHNTVAGTYTVTYSFSNGSCQNTTTTTVTKLVTPTASAIGGGASSVCVGSTTPAFTDATDGGIWSIQNGTGSATIDQNGIVTGVSAGTARVIYTVSNRCGIATRTKNITIKAISTASISYSGGPYCNSGIATVNRTGQSGGVYSSSAGLSINASSGTINLGASTPGTYVVTYNFSNGSCSNTATASVTILTGQPVAAIGGGAPSVCVGSTTPAFTDATPNGTWSIENGGGSASISSGGVVTGLSAGTVTVKYTASSSCGSNVATRALLVNAIPAATINYDGNPYCNSDVFAYVTRNGQSGGTYSSTSGLSINSSTGTVNLHNTVAGTYTVTYSFSNGSCQNTTTTTVTKLVNPTASAIGGGASPVCVGSMTPAFTNATDGGIWSIQNLTGSATIDQNGIVTGVSAGTVRVVYAVSNQCGSATRTRNVTVSSCPGTRTAQDSSVINLKTSKLQTSLAISVRPVPSQTNFTLTVKSSSQETVEINIYDVTGRKIQQLRGSAFDTYRFGDMYAAGAYLVEVLQGSNRATKEILKQ